MAFFFLFSRHADTATNVLLGQVECASEVTGIEFNLQLKQVATSHHSYIQDSPPEKRNVMKYANFKVEINESRNLSLCQKIPGTESSIQLWKQCTDKLTPL